MIQGPGSHSNVDPLQVAEGNAPQHDGDRSDSDHTSSSCVFAEKPIRWRDVAWRERWVGVVLAAYLSTGSARAALAIGGGGAALIGLHFGSVLAVHLGRRQAKADAPISRTPISQTWAAALR